MSSEAILVTGATGFIGRHLLLRLLERGHRVFALVRPAGGLSGKERLMQAMHVARGNGFPEEMRARLEALEGDLVAPGLGLPRRVQEQLAADVRQIFHCGGNTQFYPKDRAAYRAVHLDAPVNILRVIGRGQRVRFHHLSTAYVAGNRSGIAYEDELDVGQLFRNPYERIKMKSEQVIGAACEARGIDLAIFRPSIVIADPRSAHAGWSDPISTRFATFARLCRVYRRTLGRIGAGRPSLRIRGSGESTLNLVPITYVVEAMLAIGAVRDRGARTFHLVDPAPPRNQELLDRITTVFGLSELEPFKERTLPMERMSLLERATANLLRPYQDYLFESPRFDDRNARRILDGVVEPRTATALDLLARAA